VRTRRRDNAERRRLHIHSRATTDRREMEKGWKASGAIERRFSSKIRIADRATNR